MRYNKVKNTKRSKCTVCGKVRYRGYLTKVNPMEQNTNGDTWVCTPKYFYTENNQRKAEGCAQLLIDVQNSFIHRKLKILEYNKLLFNI